MAASQGRSSDPCRYNGTVVYVSLTTKTESTGPGGTTYAADVQPRCSPLAAALLDGTAP